MIEAKEYSLRREKLAASLSDNSIAVLFSGSAKNCSSDEKFNFVVNKNFFYLTGIDQEDSILLIEKLSGEIKQFLFILPYDEVKEKWYGIRLKDNEARAKSGIENVLFHDSFLPKLELLISKQLDLSSNCTLYLDLEDELKIGNKLSTQDFAEKIKNKFNDVKVENIYHTIIKFRMVKSHAEIQELKEAIRITNIGLNALLNELAPNKMEYQLAALFEYKIRDASNCKTSFPTIAAAGKNATILHYPNPTDVMKNGDLMLFDLGAEFNHYCGDISRTYPINGKYNEMQAKIYDIVLGANKHVADILKPGVTIKYLQEETIKFLANGLLNIGLIKEYDQIDKYYFHGVSHHIGLDTHDPSLRELPLQEGNVISDEPGLYIKELGIGIRIEDDLLVTRNGCIILSGDIVKERKDIEKLMSTKK